MLDEVRIHDLGVIHDATLDFHPGFTVVSGETGAGKTMVLIGIGMLLGAKPDARKVRKGEEKAHAEGIFTVESSHVAVSRTQELGGDVEKVIDANQGAESAEIIVRRSLFANGRTRAFCGGRTVPVGALADVSGTLVAVHGQADQLLLRSASKQRSILDAYAGDELAVELAAYREDWAKCGELEREVAELKASLRDREEEAATLRRGLELVESVNPVEGEQEELQLEIDRLSNVEDLRAVAESGRVAFYGEDAGGGLVGVCDLLNEVRDQLIDSPDAQLQELGAEVKTMAAAAKGVAEELAGFSSSIQADPARLAAAQERLAAVTKLTRLYGDTITEVLEWSAQSAQRLLDLDDDPGRVELLEHQILDLRAALEKRAQTMHTLRENAARTLEKHVTAELAGLAMKSATFVVDVVDTGELSAHGCDSVKLLLSAHSGADAVPLAEGASGGELSRVMLALQVVVAGSDDVPTFIFDEVDAGVGGAAAIEIGRRLAALAQQAQVIVVTHLPQVAAFADRHLVVHKSDDGQVTTSGVQEVSGDERVVELARMLAGQADSVSARVHARELLVEAGQADGSPTPASTPK